MFSTYGFLVPRTPMHPRLTSAYPPKVIGALVVAALAAGMILSLPDASSSSPNLPATSPAPQRSEESSASAGDLACGRQTWPYLDQRCADSAAKTPGQATHQVRVVSTDRGTSSTIVTAVASDPPKPPADISRLRESAAKLQSPDPQKNPAADAKQNLIQNIVAMTASVQDFPPQTMAPRGATPMANSEETEQKSKAKAADRRAIKPAKLRERNRPPIPAEAAAYAQDTGTAPEQIRTSRVPADVVQAVKNATAQERPSSRVPEDVIQAVEADSRRSAASSSGRRVIVSQKYNAQDEGEIVTVSSPRGRGQRVYLVPRESIEASSGW